MDAMGTEVNDRRTVLPPTDLEAFGDLSGFLDQVKGPAALVGPDGQAVSLPSRAFDVLVAVAHAMRAGKAITVAPMDQLLTTQEAADFLGISRPTLVKLLEGNEIPFERPGAGRHRRVRLDDVLDYQSRKRERRAGQLDELTREAADAGLYESVAEYSSAAKAARKRS